MQNAHRSHTVALLGTMAIVAVVGAAGLMAFQTNAASRTISGRGIVRDGVKSTEVPIDFLATNPSDPLVVGGRGKLLLSSGVKIYKNRGATPIGSIVQPVKADRVTFGKLIPGEEVSFKGTYTPGDKNSVRPLVITQHDRSFVVCGPLQGITQETAAKANEDALTLNVKKATIQEGRFERFFPIGKDVKFVYGDSTKFHNANGSWMAPKNRVAVDVEDIVADQQKTVVRGKVADAHTFDVTAVDMGIKCP